MNKNKLVFLRQKKYVQWLYHGDKDTGGWEAELNFALQAKNEFEKQQRKKIERKKLLQLFCHFSDLTEKLCDSH